MFSRLGVWFIGRKTGSNQEPVFPSTPTPKDLGIDKKLSSRAQSVAPSTVREDLKRQVVDHRPPDQISPQPPKGKADGKNKSTQDLDLRPTSGNGTSGGGRDASGGMKQGTGHGQPTFHFASKNGPSIYPTLAMSLTFFELHSPARCNNPPISRNKHPSKPCQVCRVHAPECK